MPRKRKTTWYEAALYLDTAGGLQRRTGIPAPVLSRVRKGTATLSPDSRRKLYNAYRRENYRRLRDAGVNLTQSRSISSAAPGKVMRYANTMDEYLHTIWERNRRSRPNLKLSDVKHGMQMSDRRADDWEEYVAMRKRQAWRPVKQHPEKRGEYQYIAKQSEVYKRWLAARGRKG